MIKVACSQGLDVSQTRLAEETHGDVRAAGQVNRLPCPSIYGSPSCRGNARFLS
jgi:hypothetical protein